MTELHDYYIPPVFFEYSPDITFQDCSIYKETNCVYCLENGVNTPVYYHSYYFGDNIVQIGKHCALAINSHCKWFTCDEHKYLAKLSKKHYLRNLFLFTTELSLPFFDKYYNRQDIKLKHSDGTIVKGCVNFGCIPKEIVDQHRGITTYSVEVVYFGYYESEPDNHVVIKNFLPINVLDELQNDQRDAIEKVLLR